MKTTLVCLYRDNPDENYQQEIKDPSIVQLKDGSYLMYATLPNAPWEGCWMGRYQAKHPQGPWQEVGPVRIHGIEGPEICAPAVIAEEKDGRTVFKMYVQTSCFLEDGVIALAVSEDGENFYPGTPPVVMAKENISASPHPVVSVYDVTISEVSRDNVAYECMTFSGYRHIGCGDIYISLREKKADDTTWSAPKMALAQEDVKFHNQPGSPNFEWGLEGAKIVQLEKDLFILVGVCFLDKDIQERGTKQRVFMAASTSLDSPFLAMDTPIAPTAYPQGMGENGHPDIIEIGDRIGILYQERSGEGKAHPWHLRYTETSRNELVEKTREFLSENKRAPIKPKLDI